MQGSHEPLGVTSPEEALKQAAGVLAKSVGPKAKLWVYSAIRDDLVQLHRPELREPGIIADGAWDFETVTSDRSSVLAFVGRIMDGAGAMDLGLSYLVRVAEASLRIRIGRRAGVSYVGFDAFSVRETEAARTIFAQAADVFPGFFTAESSGPGYDIVPVDRGVEMKIQRRAADGKSPICFTLGGSQGEVRRFLERLPHESSYKVFGRAGPSAKPDSETMALSRFVTPKAFWTYSFLGGLKGKDVDSARASGVPVPFAEWRDKDRHQFIQFELARSAEKFVMFTYKGSTQDNEG